VAKIGVGWSACTANLEAAARDRCDLFITHEPSFCEVWLPDAALRTTEWGKKRLAILDRNAMVLFALHDTWDVWPEMGIHDSWAAHLGLSQLLEREAPRPRLGISLYEIDETTLDEFAQRVAAAVAEFGEQGVIVHGEPAKRIRKVAVGTGCCCPEWSMLRRGADVLVHALDASKQTTTRLPLLDMGASIIEVEHGACEMPGMKNLAQYINDTFSQLTAVFFCEEPASRIVRSIA
jgi:putative NIF3 family GTP cyclohydrolase 1 type 2